MKIPAQGKSREEVLGALKTHKQGDVDWRDGKVFGFVFHATEEATKVVEDAFMMYLWENALDPTLFRSMLRMETEIVAMCADHLSGDENITGNLTSGGTESVLLAVKTARDYAREKKGITAPEMIIPVTAHACFHKAAHYFGVKLIVLPVNTTTFKVEVETIRNAITPNTILLVGSAVSFAHGVADPIREIAALAKERDILMHVDGCIGGFMLPYFRRAGGKTTDFDFSVPGVTSISMDLHKYAFAAKGASVVLYKTKELRKFQIFSCSNWPGYTIINPTIQSTKSGGPVAGAWAALQHIGQDGYLAVAQKLKNAVDLFKAGIAALPDFEIMGEPEMSLVAVKSDTLNIFEVCDEMAARGWHIQAQPAIMGLKENFHITMMPQNTPNIPAMLEDLAIVADLVRGRKPSEIAEQMKGVASQLDASQLDDEMVQNLLGMAGLGNNGGVPDKMAEINDILNTLPKDVADKLLTGFYNEMSRYRKPEKA